MWVEVIEMLLWGSFMGEIGEVGEGGIGEGGVGVFFVIDVRVVGKFEVDDLVWMGGFFNGGILGRVLNSECCFIFVLLLILLWCCKNGMVGCRCVCVCYSFFICDVRSCCWVYVVVVSFGVGVVMRIVIGYLYC